MVIKTRTNVYNTCYHLVFVTKYRKEIFTNENMVKYSKKLFNEIAEKHEYTILELEVMEDHVHLVVNFHPKHSISNVVRILKGAFARIWFKQYPETKYKLWGGHLWTNSYYVGTGGQVSKETVMEYVKKQLTEYNNGRSRHDSAYD